MLCLAELISESPDFDVWVLLEAVFRFARVEICIRFVITESDKFDLGSIKCDWSMILTVDRKITIGLISVL